MDLQQNICMQRRNTHTQGVFLLFHKSVVATTTQKHINLHFITSTCLSKFLFVSVRVFVCFCFQKWCLPTWHLCKFYTIFCVSSVFFLYNFYFLPHLFVCVRCSLPFFTISLCFLRWKFIVYVCVSLNVSLNVVVFVLKSWKKHRGVLL